MTKKTYQAESRHDHNCESHSYLVGALARRYIAAQVVVFLLLGPHLANLFDQPTRLFYLWTLQDAVLLVGGMMLLAVAFVAAGQFVRWLGRPFLTHIIDHCFVIGLGAGLLANLAFYNQREGYHIGQFGMEMQTLWLLLLAIVGYSVARPGGKLVLRCRQFCQMVSPAMLIVVFQIFRLQTYPPSMDPLTPPVEPVAVTAADTGDRPCPVYLFIFDGWSVDRTLENGRPTASLKNLTALCDRAAVFSDAHSPGEDTTRSVPGLLLQTDLPAIWQDGKIGFDKNGQLVGPDAFSTIFQATGNRKYRSVLVTVGPPFEQWLGERVDGCHSYMWYPRGRESATRFAAHVFEASYYWTDPWFPFVYSKLKTRVKNSHLLSVYNGITQDALNVIQNHPANTFGIFHYPLPHYPYIVNADGAYRGADWQAWQKDDVAGYQRNLARLDELVGKFTDAMKQAERYDDALVILTSDHGWRNDPRRLNGSLTDPLTHVPLIIKLPQQTEPMAVASRFETCNLGQLIELALSKKTGPHELRQALETAWINTNGLARR